jgi:two-component system sensor histidine kinase and response regulator WspE
VKADDLDELSMLDLFRMEADAQAQVLTSGLLALERDPAAADTLDDCLRAAHSLKGAARIVGLEAGVRVAHAIEDCFVAAQQKRILLDQQRVSRLLGATDLLLQIARTEEDDLHQWSDDAGSGVGACIATLEVITAAEPIAPPREDAAALLTPPAASAAAPAAVRDSAAPPSAPTDRVLRVTAESLNRLLALAGESLVESRWVKPFSESLLRVRRMQHECCSALEALRSRPALDEQTLALVASALRRAQECEHVLAQRLAELEMYDRRSLNLSHRLYDEALACRMRPFGDGVQAFPRMVRDVAQALGKQVRLDITGESTQVDRDVLAKLDAPLGHLLRNAVDHGIEAADHRRAAGKAVEGVIRLEARHSAGALQVTVSDDGGGIDPERIRAAVIARQLLDPAAAAKLTDAELLEFLFLPGFTMKAAVTDISGRGVGLDAVQDMVKQLRGVVRVSSQPGGGTRFMLQLPVTLSVVRALLAEVGGEPYAFMLSSIVRTLKLPKTRIEVLEGRQHFDLAGRRVGLVAAHQVFGGDAPAVGAADVPVIVIGDQAHCYGFVVDRFLGERQLVVQPLDPQLGKIKDISAGSLMEDGSPVLIVDPEDLLRSTERLVSEGRVSGLRVGVERRDEKKRKRVLVVDDSLTVRELERKLLRRCGYDVEVAVDGMDGWNAVRMRDFDLIVTDIDMPRMDGIELVQRIKADPRLSARPVMVVSYKDREEDRRRGLEAGASYYLTKGSFQDEGLVRAVVDLIGEATP